MTSRILAFPTQGDVDRDIHPKTLIIKAFMSPFECRRTIDVGTNRPQVLATVNMEREAKVKDRDCSVSWIHQGHMPGLFKRLDDELPAAAAHFKLDVAAESDPRPIQFTTYRKDQHFHWHHDLYGTRKLSGVIVLNDDFKGGKHQHLTSAKPTTHNLAHGDLLLFPAYIVHRCTTIKRGIRYALVMWFHGPRLK